jgi:hypothetical protein
MFSTKFFTKLGADVRDKYRKHIFEDSLDCIKPGVSFKPAGKDSDFFVLEVLLILLGNYFLPVTLYRRFLNEVQSRSSIFDGLNATNLSTTKIPIVTICQLLLIHSIIVISF